jgi:hypothetical protein
MVVFTFCLPEPPSLFSGPLSSPESPMFLRKHEQHFQQLTRTAGEACFATISKLMFVERDPICFLCLVCDLR